MKNVCRNWLFFPLVFFLNAIPAAAQNKAERARIDSVFRAIEHMPEDTNTVNFINHEAKEFLWPFDLPETYNKLKYAVKLSQKLKYDKGEFGAYSQMAAFCIRAGVGDYALQNRLKALDVAVRMKDTVKVQGQWVGLGLVYHSIHNDSLALVYFLKAQPSAERSGDSDRISRVYTFMGWAYQALGQNETALKYALKALEIRRAMHYVDGIMSSLISLRSVSLSLHQADKALLYNEEMRKQYEQLKDSSGIASTIIYAGEEAEREGKFDEALSSYMEALRIFEKTGDRNLVRDVYGDIASVLEKKGNIAGAHAYYKKFIHLRDSISEVNHKVETARTREIYDVESKNAQIDLLSKEKELSDRDAAAKQKTLVGLSLILLITLVLAVFIFRGYRQKKKSAYDIGLQKKIIEEKNTDITNSIVYAQRIQQALLPSLRQIRGAFPESFVVYQPKDIVSGDFFWFNETGNDLYIAAVDCTGHGVPGALMSMIGYNFLSQTVNEMKLRGTAEILNELPRKVLIALNKDLTTRDIKDGMDVALLRVPKNGGAIEFSGAVRPLYIMENGALKIVKGDIYSIAGVKDAEKETFTSHFIERTAGMTFYLFSDGFADQFGGPRGKKFKYRQLQELITRIHALPMDQQKKELEEVFEKWRGALEQVDDMMVIGVRVS